MKAFLREVAEHYYAQGTQKLEQMCFIFPNRRSLVFWRKYLSEIVAADPGGRPFTAPGLYTINDFFYALAGSTPTSRVSLLLELYRCYSALREEHGMAPEPLDDFIFWGDVILSDFGEIDKYLVDPDSLYRNISDLKNIQDDFSDLSEEQVRAIRQFISHFRQEGRLTVDLDSSNPSVKAGFLKIWQLMQPLYHRFRESLMEKGMSYEGMVYRRLAGRLDSESVVDILAEAFPKVTGFVFVGLNALNKCEKRLMYKMRDAGVAQWCWDYVSKMIRHPLNSSSLFMERNIAELRPAFEPEALESEAPHVSVLSVPSATGQAKQLPAIIDALAERNAPGWVPGIDTAVVLPDENLLVPVLNSIPQTVQDINVTMGYPISGSAFHALIDQVASLQLHLRQKDGRWYFYHRQVWALLGSSIIKGILDPEVLGGLDALRSKGYYIAADAFAEMPLLKDIFVPVVQDPSGADPACSAALAAYIQKLIIEVASRMTARADLAFELEFARSYYQAVTALAGEELPVKAQTWVRLLSRMVSSDAVHFQGEPLKGLQIMGPLETRALDFDNLIIMSCNEGVFPRHPVSASFIPAELRKAFDLPTYEYQDAIWAYYFYRLIQRSRNVYLVYDSRLEGVRSGEESRYIKQLEMHFSLDLDRCVAKADIGRVPEPDSIPKTQEDIARIRRRYLSASTLQAYLDCPAKFYYKVVKGLSAADEVAESLDAGMLGTVFHETMRTLYDVPGGELTQAYLQKIMADKAGIKAIVREKICAQLKTFEVTGRNLIFEDMICSYVHKLLSRELDMMQEQSLQAIKILGLELSRTVDIDGFHFTGTIDRLDSPMPGVLRVVDYKTGRVLDTEYDITDDNAAQVVEALFAPETDKRPKIALQLYLYDVIVEKHFKFRELRNAIYKPSKLFVSPIKDSVRSEFFCSLMREFLSSLLAELTDPAVDFALTDDRRRCAYCDFRMICGR